MKTRTLEKSPVDRPDRRTKADMSSMYGNPHHQDNVNVPQGPRTGNTGAHEAKRGNFLDHKQSRAPLAEMVENAYAGRQHADYDVFEESEGGEIAANNPPRKFSRK